MCAQFKSRSGGKGFPLSYPCCVLNVMVAKHNTNEQYAELLDTASKTYATSSRMSIEFEVDGPYKVLPARPFQFALLCACVFALSCQLMRSWQ